MFKLSRQQSDSAFNLDDDPSVHPQSNFEDHNDRDDSDSSDDSLDVTKRKYKTQSHPLVNFNALTISRDQTAASNFKNEQLIAVQSAQSRKRIQNPPPNSAPFIKIQRKERPPPIPPYLQGPSSPGTPPLPVNMEPRSMNPLTRGGSMGESIDLSRGLLDRALEQRQNNFGIGRNQRTFSRLSHGSKDWKLPALQLPEDNSLLDRIEMLEEENRALKCQLHCSTRTPKWQVFHFIPMPGEEGSNEIQNQTYIGQPSWDITPHREPRIKGNHLVADPKGYMFRNNIDFAINKFYSATRSANLEKAIRDNECLPAPDPVGETIDLFSDQMIDAFQSFFFARNDHKDKFPRLNVDEPLQAPFLWWYHYRTGNIFQGMAPHHRVLMNALTDWIDENYGLDYDRVDDQLSRGVVTQLAMHYLVRPGDVLITRDRKTVTASLALSWAEFEQPKPRSPHNLLHEPHKPDEETKGEWLLKSWAYEYDGSFYRKQVSIRMNPFKGPEDEFPITSLEAFPLRFAGDEVRNRLDARGSMIWSCRQKKLVTYKDDENGSYSQFMIDYATYKRLHPDSKMPLVGRTTETKYVSQAVMDRDEPPAAPERYIFPNNIIGYNLRAKKWVDLEVDLIQEVAWNKKAFENLVVDEETKDLVKALVMDQLEAERGTDLIRNKGNGLIMLLHGSPGTGKTFTAESVAEMAEKPLYSVTCGDIGTEPEKVEKYLQSVLHLGKIWNCVVLIDEAEVFLEQRTLSDLTRNALVSVFLRVLEYYDGILNLTSNRMGTFDEAFKSRILLSLHYEPLGKEQRRQVWRNFFSHLQSLDEQNIDFDDIECYIDDLADYPINGREIRNSITTARKLAQYKGKKMKFAHLQHAIKVASKFDTYLKSVHQGFDDDLIARGEGIR